MTNEKIAGEMVLIIAIKQIISSEEYWGKTPDLK
jgi:hypothetical protein